MTDGEQIEAFAKDLDRLIERYSEEFVLPYASIVGILQRKVQELIVEWQEDTGEDEPEA